MSTSSPSSEPSAGISALGCTLVLATAFLGWMCAGWQLAISSLAMRDAPADLLRDWFDEQGVGESSTAAAQPSADMVSQFDRDDDGSLSDEEKASARSATVGRWFGWLIAAFLFGAAAGGYIFGWVGDRFGRAKAMALSIVWYSVWSAATTYVGDTQQLLVLRFLTCMGIGGMWPNGIALVSEAWPNISRPVLAGAIGTAANVGIMMLSFIAKESVYRNVTADDWRWILWLGSTPVFLGVFVWFFVPESPRWLALNEGKPGDDGVDNRPGLGEIFRPPVLAVTVVGIALGTIPLFGGWGSSSWVMAWVQDPELKANLSLARSVPGTVTSLLGGALAMMMGRRLCYFVLSFGALFSAQYMFWMLTPDDNPQAFLFWFGALGFFSGFFFGWLPLCLPELFPTRVRSTGAGVSFNWGRILTAFGVLGAGQLLKQYFDGDYAQIGRLTSLIYAFGLVVVFFMPDTTKRGLDDE